jgi:hypothetical protein
MAKVGGEGGEMKLEPAFDTADKIKQKLAELDSELTAQEEIQNSEKLRKADFRVNSSLT